MARITTKAGLRNYILQELGSPVITVELAPVQLDQIIDHSIDRFQKYNTGEGNYLDYIALTVTPNVSAYSTSGLSKEIAGVVDNSMLNTSDGLNVLFSETHNILWKDWVVFGNYPGGPGSGGGMTLAGYTVMTDYLEDVRDFFQSLFFAQYNDARQEILISPSPDVAGVALLTVYTKTSVERLYNNDLVRDLCVGRAKELWGHILGKYTMTLPSGGTINGTEIKTDGKTLIDETMEKIIGESEPPGFFID